MSGLTIALVIGVIAVVILGIGIAATYNPSSSNDGSGDGYSPPTPSNPVPEPTTNYLTIEIMNLASVDARFGFVVNQNTVFDNWVSPYVDTLKTVSVSFTGSYATIGLACQLYSHAWGYIWNEHFYDDDTLYVILYDDSTANYAINHGILQVIIPNM
jgi:hypothetical protein